MNSSFVPASAPGRSWAGGAGARQTLAGSGSAAHLAGERAVSGTGRALRSWDRLSPALWSRERALPRVTLGCRSPRNQGSVWAQVGGPFGARPRRTRAAGHSEGRAGGREGAVPGPCSPGETELRLRGGLQRPDPHWLGGRRPTGREKGCRPLHPKAEPVLGDTLFHPLPEPQTPPVTRQVRSASPLCGGAGDDLDGSAPLGWTAGGVDRMSVTGGLLQAGGL